VQNLGLLQIIGIISIIIGILILCLAYAKTTHTSDMIRTHSKTESKGVILIGPIPIVWGYGKKGWLIAGVVGIILCIAAYILFN